jgi:peptidylprolyl isomerase
MTPRRSGRQKTFKHTPRKSSKKLPLEIGLLTIIVVAAVAVYMFSTSNQPSGNKVLLKTTVGDITIQLRDDRPITTTNFKNLVQQGIYDGTIFHRVIYGFIVQGGDPTGTGYGDPSIPNIQDEIDDNNHNEYGTVAMANTGEPNSGSSQFFINLANNSEIVYEDGNTFDGTYTVFGTVISGMNVVNEISNVDTDENYKPLIDVRIFSAEIIS